MSRIVDLYQSSVGKKIIMALSGAFMLVFVIGHLAGNLKIFYGQEKFDEYAHWLREMGHPLLGHGQGLWIFRILLILAVLAHVIAAMQLTGRSWSARPTAYARQERLAFSPLSYTMRWGGVAIFFFVMYHLMHLTWGTVHADFRPGEPYYNVVTGFQNWIVAAVYMVAVICLGMHLYHGLWSGMQTLGVNNPRYNAWRRPFAGVFAAVIALGYLSIPVAALAGILKLHVAGQ